MDLSTIPQKSPRVISVILCFEAKAHSKHETLIIFFANYNEKNGSLSLLAPS